MSNEGNKNLTEPKTHKKKRVRSPYLFPAYNFSLACQIAETVEKDGAGSLTPETLAENLGLSAKSSGFQLKTLTAKQFGLLAKHGDVLSTTPLAKAIFKPANEDEKRRAMTQSFLAIALFREVAARFRGQPIPQGPALRNILEREFRIDAKRVGDAERVLIDSARDTGVMQNSDEGTYLSTEQATQINRSRKEDENYTNQALTLPPVPSTTPPSLQSEILTVSVEDLAPFDDQEFRQIWDALGRIVRVRCNKQQKDEETSKGE
jgi:hypothetical protein